MPISLCQHPSQSSCTRSRNAAVSVATAALLPDTVHLLSIGGDIDGYRCLEDLADVDGARVLVRTDLRDLGTVMSSADDFRLLGTLSTVGWLQAHGAPDDEDGVTIGPIRVGQIGAQTQVRRDCYRPVPVSMTGVKTISIYIIN